MAQEQDRKGPRWLRKITRFPERLESANLDSNPVTGSTGYRYPPLDPTWKEIRLLRLESQYPSLADDETLHFRVCVAQLAKRVLKRPPKYYAISYVWGDDPGYATLNLDGVESTVPGSAEQALRGIIRGLRIAGMDQTLPIWIDAVCINQSDLKEKSKQVAMMGSIYSLAQLTLIWVGPENEFTRAAVETIHLLNDDAIKHAGGRKALDRIVSLDYNERTKLPCWNLDLPSGCDWEAFLDFLQAKWFTRLWVLQELVLAKDAVFFSGRQHIPSKIVAVASLCSFHRVRQIKPLDVFRNGLLETFILVNLMFSMFLKRRSRDHSHTYTSVTGLFMIPLKMETSNQLDKIYALLGLLDERILNVNSASVKLVPNYTKSIIELYGDATFFAINVAGDLEIIEYSHSMVDLEEVNNDDWPSWIVPYHLDKQFARLGCPWYAYAAAATKSHPMVCRRDPQNSSILQVRGVCVGTIDLLQHVMAGETRDGSLDSPAVCPILLDHNSYLLNPSVAEANTVAWTLEKLFTLACAFLGGDYHGCDAETSTDVLRDFAAFLLEATRQRSWPTNPTWETLLHDCGAEQGSSEDFSLSIVQNGLKLENCPLIKLSGDQFGLVGLLAAQDDKVCILFGADHPFVMRQQGDHWKIRGPCYVPGIMKGEYINRLREEERLEAEVQTFYIN